MKSIEYKKKRTLKKIIDCGFDCENCEKSPMEFRKDLFYLFYAIVELGIKRGRRKKKFKETIESLYM